MQKLKSSPKRFNSSHYFGSSAFNSPDVPSLARLPPSCHGSTRLVARSAFASISVYAPLHFFTRRGGKEPHEKDDTTLEGKRRASVRCVFVLRCSKKENSDSETQPAKPLPWRALTFAPRPLDGVAPSPFSRCSSHRFATRAFDQNVVLCPAWWHALARGLAW